MKEKYMQMLYDYVNSECFPKSCKCGRVYKDDLEYTVGTMVCGKAKHYQIKNEPHGFIAFFRNCPPPCKSTLVISLDNPERFGSGTKDFIDFVAYIADRAKREEKEYEDVLTEFREEYNAWVLSSKANLKPQV